MLLALLMVIIQEAEWAEAAGGQCVTTALETTTGEVVTMTAGNLTDNGSGARCANDLDI